MGETPMTDRIELLSMAQKLAEHAATRQSVVAKNIANVDTPGFKRLGLPSFAETYEASGGSASMRATRPGHLGAMSDSMPMKARVQDGGTVKPNGNNVSLEDEILTSADIRQQHEMALSIYQSGLGIMRASLGR
ncbi:FlgB family protein [Tropicimonas sp. TH_r6]|uniref:FlgB family protein n=1 Tax=Tropicimonas sp. TH_r6 TaxID=3082085 RepID=UPI0029548D1D|nr:FlgB family protein [Tropicimonas sp. TH_r6]MDV7141388.1 FlgB family protein [Tropicimonas sp. TH_r6]